ncbi:MAG: VWA domain-containing protein [Chloroflexi bacterium]|nr:VWA domain-containing protein [Chloroflexota bacterium]
MDFQWPFMLWVLLLVPVLILAYIWAQRRRQRYAVRYASLSLVKEALGKGPGFRRHIPPLLFLFGLTAMMLALTRPIAVIRVPSEEGVILLAMDTSGSMQANDVQPNRMEAAKAAARIFVERQPQSVRIGVVSFSDNAFVVQSPTTDQDSVIAAVNRLYPQRGTAIGRGLQASLSAIFDVPDNDDPAAALRGPSGQFGPGGQLGPGGQFGANPSSAPTPEPSPTPLPKGVFVPAVVILLTDGENNQGPEPGEIAQQLADRGVRVYTVGIGSSEGSVLQIQGRSIRTRLDEDLLKQVAETANGAYYNATNEKELENIYANLGTKLVLRTERTEVTALLTGIAALFSIIGGALSLLWFNRLP